MKRMTATAKLLRRASTRSEQLLWDALRDGKLEGTKWRRQQKIERFVVDFFCADARLVVEIDGGIHVDRREADLDRQRTLERYGLRVVRFEADTVERSLSYVLTQLRGARRPLSPVAAISEEFRAPLVAPLSPCGRGAGAPPRRRRGGVRVRGESEPADRRPLYTPSTRICRLLFGVKGIA
jgi:very-short-patch-repair endonuclease